MSPSELDTKAPSVPPHPFKVGDKVILKENHGKVFEVIPGKSEWPNRVYMKDSTGRETWDSGFEIELAPFFNPKPANKPEDAVNHPNHYTASTLETIDAIEAMVGQAGWSPATGFRLGNVLKYLWRHAQKGGLESLKKARWYLDREIAAVEKAVEKAVKP